MSLNNKDCLVVNRTRKSIEQNNEQDNKTGVDDVMENYQKNIVDEKDEIVEIDDGLVGSEDENQKAKSLGEDVFLEPQRQKNDGLVSRPARPENTRNYTQISGASQCNCTVKYLKVLNSGRVSATTLLNTYLFQYLVVGGGNQELRNLLQEGSRIEMQHSRLLGEAIVLFGGLPKLSNGQGAPWSARYLNYETNPNRIILNNIRLIEFYIRQLNIVKQRVPNQSLKSLISEIIEDEDIVLERFKKLV